MENRTAFPPVFWVANLIEVLERFVREVAFVEFGGAPAQRDQRLSEIRQLTHNDLTADRQVVAAVQAMEAILARRAENRPDCVVNVNAALAAKPLWMKSRRVSLRIAVTPVYRSGKGADCRC